MSLSVNGFLSVLSVLASGYIIYAAPARRVFWAKLSRKEKVLEYEKVSGYDLYFSIIATGLSLFYVCYGLIYFDLLKFIPLKFIAAYTPYSNSFKFTAEHAPFLTLVFAIIFALVSQLIILFINERLKGKIKLTEGLEHLIYNLADAKKTITVTLENGKIYMGWPVDVIKSKDSRWLSLIPAWSGYRDTHSVVKITIDYSKIYDEFPRTENRMLIAVDSIVTIQPFEREIYKKLNAEK